MRRGVGFIMVAIAVMALGAFAPAARAETGAYEVAPEACVIDPVPLPQPGEVGNLATPTPTPTPISVDRGRPVTPEVAQAVTARIEHAIACQNAGDPLRVLANFTERWVSDRFSGYDLVFYRRFRAAAENPAPLPPDDRIELLIVDQVMEQADGSVVATVKTRQRGEEQTSLVVLREEAGDWLIDDGAVTAAN